jgi:hypothetical protein
LTVRAVFPFQTTTGPGDYILRPPLALQRLSQGENGRVVYRMKRPRDGSLFLVLTSDELLGGRGGRNRRAVGRAGR